LPKFYIFSESIGLLKLPLYLFMIQNKF